MTDKEAMYTRFSHKNIHKSTGKIAKELGVNRKDFEQAVENGMKQESCKEARKQEQSMI